MKAKLSKKNTPAGWSEKRLGDVLRVGSGKDYKHLEKGNVPVFGTGGQMLSVNQSLHAGETVFIGRKGTIDKPFYFKGRFWTVDTLFYTYGYKETSARFINYVFQKINWLSYNEASGVPSLSKTTIEGIDFVFPPKPEQDRIVVVLETWDQAIKKLTRKIEIKKEVKKGLMQELLTGKTRLPGFEDKWDFLKLGDIGTFRGGNGFPERFQGNFTGTYPFFKVSDMNNVGNGVYMHVANHWIEENIRKEIKATIFPKDTIVLAKIGAALFLERKRILVQPSCIDNNMMGFVVNDFDKDFIFYKFLMLQFSRYANTTALPSLSGTELSEIEIRIPNSRKEQSAIANILTTADKEIKLLNQKLLFLKDQKKHLLNNLITGTIRTPESLSIPN
uniref:Type I restriction modification DNA specificity domain-containing protein n=1 Tax=Candidatus Nitrotoga fabula TaxID=2182327 RepID=A0A2X0R5M0_9PROT|nr:conserved protein of unknown function [Candidatus Nitrotoga fabula]